MIMNMEVVRIGLYNDGDSTDDSDNSDTSNDTSSSGISDSINSVDTDENNENCKNELQKLLDSSKPRDKENLNAKIIDIVKKDNKVLFMYLIANNYKLEVLNNKGQTALHLAWYNASNLSGILYLITDFPNYVTESHTDCNGLNYLHIASSIAHEKFVRSCLKAGVDVNSQFHTDPKNSQHKFTALHYAASNMIDESIKVMKLLLKNGADVNAVDYLGRTPLHIACQVYEEIMFSNDLYSCNSSKFVKILVEKGSDLNARDNNGKTPLLSIISENYNEFEFETGGNPISLPYKEIQEKIKYFLKKDVDFLATDNDGNNILHRIIQNLKLSRYPTYNSVDFSYDADYAKMIKRILTANKGIDVNGKNCFGDAPLQLAVSLMSVDIVKVFLKYNANLTSLTFNHYDEYCFCCPNKCPNLEVVQKVISMIKLLLKKGWKLTFKNNLSLMQFLIHDIDYCECENISDNEYQILSNLCNLIDYSSALHFEKVLDKVINDLIIQDKNYERNFVLEGISKALHYRKIFKLHTDIDIVDIAKKYLLTRCTFKDSDSSSKKDDIVRMKYIKLKTKVTLYDVMARHPHRIYGCIKNHNFDEITENFLCFEDVVKGHVAKSLVRHHIEKMAIEYLRILFFPSIPSLCCKQILSFLSNVEIINACSAAIFEDE